MLCVISIIPVTGKEQVLSTTDFSFPNTRPGEVFKVEKVIDDESGDIKAKCNGKEVSMQEIEKMRTEEENALNKKHGAVKGKLREELEKMKDESQVEVSISLRPPRYEYLDKTRYPIETWLNHGKTFVEKKPGRSIHQVLENFGIKIEKLDSKGSESEWGIECRITKKDLLKLSLLPEVGSISKYEKPMPCVTFPAPLASLATSAHNPSPYWNSNWGQGVRAATFEWGIWEGKWESVLNDHVYHFSARGNLDPDKVQTTSTASDGHTQTVFSNLWYAAPKAEFHHQIGTIYGNSYSDAIASYMLNNSLQSVSISYARPSSSPNDPEMLLMDDFAYVLAPVFCNPANNQGATGTVDWCCYNAISVGSSQHENLNHYVWATHSNCINPPAEYGSLKDREMPYILAPGKWPYAVELADAPYVDPYDPTVPLGFAFESALKRPWSINCQGTSFAAPTANGFAVRIISDNPSVFSYWPEKVRAVMILTAQNCDGGEWNCAIDGKDGAGTLCGLDAEFFAMNHTSVWPGDAAVQNGLCGDSWHEFMTGTKSFLIKIPRNRPIGKHLRVVLTWDSKPYLPAVKNYLSDLDLRVTRGLSTLGYSSSWNGNVEVVDIPRNSLISGETITAEASPFRFRFDSSEQSRFFYYSIGWTWVKDHAQ